MNKRWLIWGCAALLMLAGCSDKRNAPAAAPPEDTYAKQLLQGIWVNVDDEDVAFRAQGDSIFYPDSTSLPVHFMIIEDTLIMQGAHTVKYPIVKQAKHLFQFKNQNGEVVKLVKSDEESDRQQFENVSRPVALNQKQLIKRDTVVSYHGERYHSYVQVNPTTYKVIKTSYNGEGVEVENVYYDNIVNLAVFHGAAKLFSSDFHKKDFSAQVPIDFLSQGILSDMEFSGIDDAGVHHRAIIGIPDSPSSYVVEVVVDYHGKLKMQVVNK